MARQEELEIEIGPTGELKVEVKGAGGKRCLEYVELFRSWLGPVEAQRLTPEYYEVKIPAQARERLRQRDRSG